MSDREAFEKWYQDKFKRAAIESGYETYLTWQAWQAAQAQTLLEVIRDDSGCPTEVRIAQAGDGEAVIAQAQASDPVAVADKGVINWIDGKQFDHEADLYTQPAVNQQLLEAKEAGFWGRTAARQSQRIEELLDLLETFFSLYEDGTACYEDPEDCSGFLGYALHLDDNTFNRIAQILNEARPRAAIEAAQEQSNSRPAKGEK